MAPLFDDLVRASKKQLRDGDSKGLRGLEIDGELDLRDLLHRQVGRLLALEDAGGVQPDQTGSFSRTASVAHQAAGRGEFRNHMDRGHPVAQRQRRKRFAAGVQKPFIGNNEPCPCSKMYLAWESSAR